MSIIDLGCVFIICVTVVACVHIVCKTIRKDIESNKDSIANNKKLREDIDDIRVSIGTVLKRISDMDIPVK